MGRRASQIRKQTFRKIRVPPLDEAERSRLERAVYEGSPYHKRNLGDFDLTPPAAPRPDATLCDEAGITTRTAAAALFERAIERGLVSEATTHGGFPKQIWVVDERGQVFEAMYGGSRAGSYHGYPIRMTDPLFLAVTKAWNQ